MSLIENERTKLLATALNNVAVATVATALIAPTASFLYTEGRSAFQIWRFGLAAVWFAGGLCLDLFAHIVLGRLKP
nr:hypothetical protein [uncultured Rhodopila sp.]